jgi:hypothetical protein
MAEPGRPRVLDEGKLREIAALVLAGAVEVTVRPSRRAGTSLGSVSDGKQVRKPCRL